MKLKKTIIEIIKDFFFIIKNHVDTQFLFK